MSHVRFNHVFITLLLLSGICAFLIPVQHSNRLRGWVDVVFAPVAYPIRRVAQILISRGQPTMVVATNQPSSETTREIGQLRAKVARLTVQLAELRRLYKDRDLVGNAEEYSVPVKVIGGDSSSRDALLLAGTSTDGVEVGMCVLYRDFVVGKITAVGGGGAQVRLLTDAGFRANGLFARFDGTEYVPLPTSPPQVEGTGRGTMTIANLTFKQVQEIHAGDVVQLYDPEDWPTIVHGSFLGHVEKIEPHPKNPLFAQITVRPWEDLHRLNEVMVLTLKPAAAASTSVTPITHPAETSMNKLERKGQHSN